MSENVFLATTDDEIRSCYPVMSELRPHVQPDEFLSRVKRQREIAGYELAYFRDKQDGEVKSVAGFSHLRIARLGKISLCGRSRFPERWTIKGLRRRRVRLVGRLC
jgi:hypothetical protein